MNQSAPFLSRIQIFPLKSFDGIRLNSVAFTKPGSLDNDRRFALINSHQKIMTAKKLEKIHTLQVQFNTDFSSITIGERTSRQRQTFCLQQEQAELEAWLSDYLGQPLRWTENKSGGFPDDPDAHGPTIVSVATLQTVAEWFPGMTIDEVRMRFRANLEIDGVEPFWEDQLFGEVGQSVSFQLGDVRLQGLRPCPRCAVPGRSPYDGTTHSGFQQKFAEKRRQHFPDWSNTSQFPHFYFLAVNTMLHAENDAWEIQEGDLLQFHDSSNIS